MNILIGLVPAILWGIMPIAVNKFGGHPISQLLGTVYGAVILGLLIVFINHPVITKEIFWWNFLAGICWAFGQLTQYSAYTEIGVSRTMPLTTGAQLVLVSLIGVLFFGSWGTSVAKWLGLVAILLDMLGVILTTVQDKSSQGSISKHNFKLGVTNALVGTLGFVIYNSLPKIPNVSGWRMFFPQTLGMLFATFVMTLLIKKYRTSKPFFSKSTLKNIITGFMFGGACCGFLFSIKLNGLSTGFTLSQFCVAIATISGIAILHEHKTHRELMYTLLGLFAIIVGSIIVGNIK